MSRTSNGTYVQPGGTAAISLANISSVEFNALISDIGSEITNSLDRLGRGAMEAPLDMGTNRLGNMADPTYATDAVTLQYFQANAIGSAGGIVNGPLAVSVSGAASATFAISKGASGQAASIFGETATSYRWQVVLGDATPESGGNAGSNFLIAGYSDTGNIIADYMLIYRATGNVVFGYGVTVGNGLTVNGSQIVANLGLTVAGGSTSLGATAISGTATAPTVGATDNSTNIATTAFVNAMIGNAPVIGAATTAAPPALDHSARMPNTAWVVDNWPGISAAQAMGAIGSYIIAEYAGGALNAGATIAGSSLNIPGVGGGSGSTPSGTWMLLGGVLGTAGSHPGLYKRIS